MNWHAWIIFKFVLHELSFENAHQERCGRTLKHHKCSIDGRSTACNCTSIKSWRPASAKDSAKIRCGQELWRFSHLLPNVTYKAPSAWHKVHVLTRSHTFARVGRQDRYVIATTSTGFFLATPTTSTDGLDPDVTIMCVTLTPHALLISVRYISV